MEDKFTGDSQVDTLMRNILDTNDLYFVALLLLDKLKGTKKYNILAELSYLLDIQSFMNLIFYFEGLTITIPTREELRQSLSMLTLYYNYEILKKSWRECIIAIDGKYSKDADKKYWSQYKKFRKELSVVEFPSELKLGGKGGSDTNGN